MKNNNKKKKKIEECASFINMPISLEQEDKIGIGQHALELKDAINKGAQIIAVTSDFGGGKSSLIKYLESLYSKITTKFCYVNLWCELDNINEKTTIHTETNIKAETSYTNANLLEIHKTFIYQLSSQISDRKGKYVSKRLSKNYGLVKLSLQNRWLSIISYVMFLFIIIGVLCIPLYDNPFVSSVLDFEFIKNYHNPIGLAAFCVAIILGLLIIYNADIVFSAKQSDNGRDIDEHELMDIYKSYLCNYHFKHYIVVIEDLDRSDDLSTQKFIKELRRYYVPCQKNKFKAEWINKALNKLGLFNRNRITFIVNIKPENCMDIKTRGLYSKVFDYILNLKKISIDNYDVVLKKLLEDNKEYFSKNKIPVFEDGEIIPEFEWLKRGRNLDIRELKTRLNSTISSYINLCYKFGNYKISLKKCIVAAYIISEFPEEFEKTEKIGLDRVIDAYVSNPNITNNQVINIYSKDDSVSLNFASELIKLIKNRLIDIDYKQYFYNYPSGSYLHTPIENQLINTILYDLDVSNDKSFDNFVQLATGYNHNLLYKVFDRLKNLGMLCPKCIFYSHNLFDFAITHFTDMVWETIEKELVYDDNSIVSTAKILMPIIENDIINDSKKIEKLCLILTKRCSPHAIINFRKVLIEKTNSQILFFSCLYSAESPLITKAEINLLKKPSLFLNLIDYTSTELSIDLVTTIQRVLLLEVDMNNKNEVALIKEYYLRISQALIDEDNQTITNCIFDFCISKQIIFDEVIDVLFNYNVFSSISDRYIELLNIVSRNQKLSKKSLLNIKSQKIKSGLDLQVCNQLLENGFTKNYLVNAMFNNIDTIDFSDVNIIKSINDWDFSNDDLLDFDLLSKIRKWILRYPIDFVTKNYLSLFYNENPIIDNEELALINNRISALKLIDINKITEDNYKFFSNYFSDKIYTQNESFLLLEYVCSIKDSIVKKLLFLSLDFTKIQYHRISSARKLQIKEAISNALDFSKLEDQILFMLKTQTSNSDFEKQIKKSIEAKSFTKYEERYVEYVNSLKKITIETIENLCSLNQIYVVSPLVQEELYNCGKYDYYVCAKTRYNENFIFEKDKLDILLPTYIQIFISGENLYKITKPYMMENREFVEYLLDNKKYKNLKEFDRKLFANALQTVDALKDLFNNYTISFCIEYLKEIVGFKDKSAAECFLNEIKIRKDIVSSEEVYKNVYEKLVDFSLKAKYTRYHNKARE